MVFLPFEVFLGNHLRESSAERAVERIDDGAERLFARRKRPHPDDDDVSLDFQRICRTESDFQGHEVRYASRAVCNCGAKS